MALGTRLVRRLGEVAYQGECLWETAAPAPELVELVEGPDRLAPGRALDIGCGTGTSSVYLARAGWEVTGIDMVSTAVDAARRKAMAADLRISLVEGDVTRLADLGIRGPFELLVDLGCYHMVPAGRRPAYAESVTGVAAPGAVLLMLGMGRFGTFGLAEHELRRQFPGWVLTRKAEIPGSKFWPRFPASRRLRLLSRLPLHVWHFELRRPGTVA